MSATSEAAVVSRLWVCELARLATVLGHTPFTHDILRARRSHRFDLPAKITWNRHFGSLQRYQAAAGLVPNRQGGRRVLRSHCRRAGHPLTPANTYDYVLANGHRQRICKACQSVRVLESRRRRQAASIRVRRFQAAQLRRHWIRPARQRVIRFIETERTAVIHG